MRNLTSLLAGTACAATAALLSSNASAHIELLDPPARYEVPANKSCPCGDGDSNRTCNVSAAESTDPNRGTNVTTFEAGSTITIHAEEYIDHAGRMRVAFDPDGADFADFNDNVLLDVADPADPTIAQAPLGWDFTVTLPTEPCDNCTLQVVQVMQVPTDVPYPDPSTASTYYTCADIRIVPAGTLGSDPEGAGGTGAGAGGSANAGSAAAGGAAGAGGSAIAEDGGAAGTGPARAGSGGTGTGSSAAGRGGTSPAAAAGTSSVAEAGDEESDDGGCAIQPGSARRGTAWLVAGMAGAAVALLRRRRR